MSPNPGSEAPQGGETFPAGPVTSAGGPTPPPLRPPPPPPQSLPPPPPSAAPFERPIWVTTEPPAATSDVIANGGAGLSRRTMLWFSGAAGVVLIAGLIAVLVIVLNGSPSPSRGAVSARPAPTDDLRPPLAKLCPPPSEPAGPAPHDPPLEADGPRTVDQQAGISYRAYGPPWQTWPLLWRGGTLGIPYAVGQHFVTEQYGGGEYHASILSAAVPVAVNDSMVVDLVCTGRQVAADVRAEYYPQPNEMDLMVDELTTLGGRPAWLTKFRLHFDEDGLDAKDELVAVAVIDVGRPTAAVLYVSIPGTHRQWDHVVDEVLASVRPI